MDFSSPRATLMGFLESMDNVGRILAEEYLPSPTAGCYQRLLAASEAPILALDLSELPMAGREKAGRAALVALYETLSRIQLPPWEDIPDLESIESGKGVSKQQSETPPAMEPTPEIKQWKVPHTDIVLVRMPDGPREGEYLFSPATVARAKEFRRAVGERPYARDVPLEHLEQILVDWAGWMIPYRWIEPLPSAMRLPVWGQALWKWLALLILLIVLFALLLVVRGISHSISKLHPFLQAVAEAALPVFLLLAMPVVLYFALVQIRFFGTAGSVIESIGVAIKYLAGAWIAWRMAPVVAEGIIASPHIPTESVDAHLIRITARLFGIVAGAVLLAWGADQLGVPVYGIVAGLGVGGLAIALAAQPSVENLIGGLSLFADKPIRVGDFCKYGDKTGIVEGIGIRSTRIRGLDRKLTTIPNASLSKMAIVNSTLRDKTLIQTVVGLRYETSSDQLRELLGKLSTLLANHPQIESDTARARFLAFGEFSLNVEIFAYALTNDWVEFLAIQEDVLLQIMETIGTSSTGFAFPSQTLYLSRDAGRNPPSRRDSRI